MKVDGLGVLLAVILMPIILVVTYYIQLEVDTIATENSYNTKLLDATYDAMSAFEINTANEDLSTVADSMRSIILASNNIFLNTLATNFGISNASKEYLQPYIPAVLYTMYDGFYIYAPTETAKVVEKKEDDPNDSSLKISKGYLKKGDAGTDDVGGVYGDVIYEKKGGGQTTDISNAATETDYILKSYMQYSARYQNGNKDVTINYTLDNYLNIEGKIGDVYYTKSGYLIYNDLVTNIFVTDINGNKIEYFKSTTNEDDIKNKILGVDTNVPETTIDAAQQIGIKLEDGTSISANWDNVENNLKAIDDSINIRTISEAETYLKRIYSDNNTINDNVRNLEYEVQKYKAIAYYASSACFSDWVYTNLSDLTYGNIVDDAVSKYYKNDDYKSTSGAGKSDLYYSFEGNTTHIFDKNQDPEDTKLNFNTHKLEVIKNSIKYNLNLSMSAYNKMDKKLKDYTASMPVLLDEEWDKILNNISIVSFMQGWDCGLDIYNNYQIVSSTNNELAVTPSEIYYVKKEEFNNSGRNSGSINDGSGNYHRIDCPYLDDTNDYISFKSKEVKYDKVYDKTSSTGGQYKYDHKNLACYTCINTNNYKSLMDLSKTSYYERIATLRKKSDSKDISENKKCAAYIGLAKERQNTYKTNALPVSEGYKIIKKDKTSCNNNSFSQNNVNLINVKQLQITFSNISAQSTVKEPVLKLRCLISENETPISIPTQIKATTVVVDVSNGNVSSTIAINQDGSEQTLVSYGYTVESIKAIYK